MLLPACRSVYDLNGIMSGTGSTTGHVVENRRPPRASGPRSADLPASAGWKLPKPDVEKLGSLERPGYRIEKLLLKPDDGIVLPALLFLPVKGPKVGRVVLYLHERGKAADAAAGGAIERLVQDGLRVLAVDLRGVGQTRSADGETKDVFMAYLLGRSYVGVWAEDVLLWRGTPGSWPAPPAKWTWLPSAKSGRPPCMRRLSSPSCSGR